MALNCLDGDSCSCQHSSDRTKDEMPLTNRQQLPVVYVTRSETFSACHRLHRSSLCVRVNRLVCIVVIIIIIVIVIIIIGCTGRRGRNSLCPDLYNRSSSSPSMISRRRTCPILGWWQTVQVSCTRNSYENLGTRNLSVCHKFSCEFFLVRQTWMK